MLDEFEALLTTSTVAGGGTGWGIYKGHMPDSSTIGAKAVALIQTPGRGRMGALDIERARLQVVIRGEPQNTSTDAYEATKAKAAEVRAALHEYTGSDLTDGTHYVGVWCEGIYPAEMDESWRPVFVGEFRAMRSV